MKEVHSESVTKYLMIIIHGNIERNDIVQQYKTSKLKAMCELNSYSMN